jgi:hypothetical protein
MAVSNTFQFKRLTQLLLSFQESSIELVQVTVAIIRLLRTERESANFLSRGRTVMESVRRALLIALAINWEDSVQAFCFNYKL